MTNDVRTHFENVSQKIRWASTLWLFAIGLLLGLHRRGLGLYLISEGLMSFLMWRSSRWL